MPDRAGAGVPAFVLQAVTDRQDDVDGGRVIDAGRLLRGPRVGIERSVALREESLTDCVERRTRDAQGLTKRGDGRGVRSVGVESDDLTADEGR